MLKDLFSKRQYATLSASTLKRAASEEEKPNVPNGMWVKCDKCNNMIYRDDLENNKFVCTSCGHHFRLTAEERIRMFIDKQTFNEINGDLKTTNPLKFDGYEEIKE